MAMRSQGHLDVSPNFATLQMCIMIPVAHLLKGNNNVCPAVSLQELNNIILAVTLDFYYGEGTTSPYICSTALYFSNTEIRHESYKPDISNTG